MTEKTGKRAFLTKRTTEILQQGPTLDTNRNYESENWKDKRQKHRNNYNKHKRKAIHRAKMALWELLFLSRTLGDDDVREIFLSPEGSGHEWFTSLLAEVVARTGWREVPEEENGKGERYMQRFAAAIQGGLRKKDKAGPHPEVKIHLPVSVGLPATDVPYGVKYQDEIQEGERRPISPLSEDAL